MGTKMPQQTKLKQCFIVRLIVQYACDSSVFRPNKTQHMLIIIHKDITMNYFGLLWAN